MGIFTNSLVDIQFSLIPLPYRCQAVISQQGYVQHVSNAVIINNCIGRIEFGDVPFDIINHMLSIILVLNYVYHSVYIRDIDFGIPVHICPNQNRCGMVRS